MTPFEQGAQARDLGCSIFDNPYPIHSFFASQWRCGWIEMNKRLERELAEKQKRRSVYERVKALVVGVCT